MQDSYSKSKNSTASYNTRTNIKPNSEPSKLKTARILDNFNLKVKQVLIDDIRMRKQFQLIDLSQSLELLKYLNEFRNCKKEQWIELASYLLQKQIDLINLKICLEYFLNGIKIKEFQPLFPAYKLLDTYTCQILTDATNKIFETQCWDLLNDSYDRLYKKTTFSHKDSVQFMEKQDKYTISPIKLLGQSGKNRQSNSSKDSRKKSKDMLSPFQSYFQMISTGNLQSANENLDEQVKNKFSTQIKVFNQSCTVIKDVIKYFNQKVLKQQFIEPEANLNVLKDCLQKVYKKQNKKSPHQIPLTLNQLCKPFQRHVKSPYEQQIQLKSKLIQEKKKKLTLQSSTTLYKFDQIWCEQSYPDIKGLEMALQQTKNLFNKKSVEHAFVQRRNIELQTSMKKIENQNQGLNKIISDLQGSLKLAKNQILVKSQQIEQDRLINSCVSDCQNCQILQQANQQLQKQIKNFKKQKQDIENQLQKSVKQLNLIRSKQKTYACMIYFYTKINYQLQTSNILEPIQEKNFEKHVLTNIQMLAQAQISKRVKFIKENVQDIGKKMFLINEIQKYVNQLQNNNNPRIRAFKLIYRYNDQLKTNFHQYVDGIPRFLVLVKLNNGTTLGGYSHQALKKGVKTQHGFIFSLSLMQAYFLKQKYCLGYQDYYLAFGNSQIRIRVGQNTLYSNFGISNAHFASKGRKYNQFLNSQNQRQVGIQHFEVFQVFFEDT